MLGIGMQDIGLLGFVVSVNWNKEAEHVCIRHVKYLLFLCIYNIYLMLGFYSPQAQVRAGTKSREPTMEREANERTSKWLKHYQGLRSIHPRYNLRVENALWFYDSGYIKNAK